jgi:hypothetical protein
VRERYREALRTDEAGEGVAAGGHDESPGALAVSDERGRDLADSPDHGTGVADADRAVPELQRRVGLGPGLGCLPQLQRGLVGDEGRPAAPEEGELVVAGDPGGQWPAELGRGGQRQRAEVRAQVGADEDEGAADELAGDDRALSGEVQQHDVVGLLGQRRFRLGGDRRGDDPGRGRPQGGQHLGGGAGPGDEDQVVVGAGAGHL